MLTQIKIKTPTGTDRTLDQVVYFADAPCAFFWLRSDAIAFIRAAMTDCPGVGYTLHSGDSDVFEYNTLADLG